jgi:hypothetical protein
MHFNLCNRILAASCVLISSIAPLAAQDALSVGQKPPELVWTLQDSKTTASLRGIFSVDARIAWASGSGGTVLKTIDGGANWTPCSTPPDAQSLDFRGIQAWDEFRAIVMASGPGDKSRLFKTEDGGKSWQLLFKNPDTPDGFFDSFFADFSEETGKPVWHGSILGDPVHGSIVLYDTRDSGETWVQRKNNDLALDTAEVAGFAASNSLFPANQDNTHLANIFASGGKAGSFVWIERTEQAAPPIAGEVPPPIKHWKRISVPITAGNDSSGIFSIAADKDQVPFRNVISIRETLIAVGGDYQKPNDSTATAAWSTDRIHWTAAARQPHGYRSAVGWSEQFDAWVAVGTNGSDISRDDGKTWTLLDKGDWNALSLPFVVGPKGRIARLSQAELQ